MRNALFAVMIFVTGCYSNVEPQRDLCDEFCTAVEQDGCARDGCRDRCNSGRQTFTELHCEQEYVEFAECQLSWDNICEAAGSNRCEYEANQLTACGTLHTCEDLCATRELNACGDVSCVSDCVAAQALAHEMWCMPDWNAWTACERGSRACGECARERGTLEVCLNDSM